MPATTYDKLKLVSPWKILSVFKLSIRKELNEHAVLHLTAMLSEADGVKAALRETVNDRIQIYIDDAERKATLFKGILQEVGVHAEYGFYTLTAVFLSESVLLDTQLKSRSFQNTQLAYRDIVTKIIQDYPGKKFECTAAKAIIDGPLLQYEETDWQFIKRLASYQETVIVPDTTVTDRIFAYGYPSGGSKTLPDAIAYASGKNLRNFEIDHTYKPGLSDIEYCYYEVETYEPLNLGDQVTFQNVQLYVGSVTIELWQGLLVYKAKLVRKKTIRQNPIYNEKLMGVTLPGKVLALENQTVKLHLTIDAEQNPDEAYWYPFAPPTTGMMYLMPQLGTVAGLYIPGLREQNAIITGNLRTNGANCQQTGDPNTRYLATEYGQELKIAPGGVYITAGNTQLTAFFDDEAGVTLSSHKGIDLNAAEEIIIHTEKKVSLEAPSQIRMLTPNSGLSMENEMHFRAEKVQADFTDEEEFPPVEQPKPPPKQSYVLNRPQDKAKPGINWGAIAVGAVAAVAAIAVCVVAAPAVAVAGAAVATAVGASATGVVASLATGAMLGAIGGAVSAIVGTGGSDILHGKFSGIDKYIENVLKDALIGAITGAIFESALIGAKTLWTIVKNGRYLENEIGAVRLGAEESSEASVSEADRLKLGKWENPPSDELYLANKEVYDNPKYFNQETGETIWPGQNGDPNTNGFVNGESMPDSLTKGQIIDRFGENANGRFFSEGETPFENRALPPSMQGATLDQYVVLKPFNVESGPIAPWFDQPGLGKQYFTSGQILDRNGDLVPANLGNLKANGYIKKL
ncbi:phage late control gene d protein (gpd) [Lucifera butyrica]|uniref:Phage late control gene d protein (Gpd) n=1 Tax=Lucifera butyrica TaxID=1351585 RepID=A0A498RG17_9FIRM|nr:glycohydrolase toxin TNT-related protein [Lucifera butyrica]VBB09033.1 phage late control gene d protein (gpd) [Lucifera butyrica]